MTITARGCKSFFLKDTVLSSIKNDASFFYMFADLCIIPDT